MKGRRDTLRKEEREGRSKIERKRRKITTTEEPQKGKNIEQEREEHNEEQDNTNLRKEN